MEHYSLKAEMVATCQAALRQGLFAGTSGNLSVFLPQTQEMAITPSCVRYETMTPEDIVVMRLDGEVTQGKYPPSSEWQMHQQVYQHIPTIGAIFHTHSPYATAFAVNHMAIPAVLIEMYVFLGGPIQCAPYATPGTPEVGKSVLSMLQNGQGGCLLANHGVLAVGSDLAQARLRAEYIEDAAKIYHYAAQIGSPVSLPKL